MKMTDGSDSPDRALHSVLQEQPPTAPADEPDLGGDLLAAQEGDALARARIAHRAADRAERDTADLRAAAEATLTDLENNPRTSRGRILEQGAKVGIATRAHDAALADLAAAEAVRDRLAAIAADPDGDGTAQPRLRYESVLDFVREFVIPNWRHRNRDVKEARWCGQWYEHSEAVVRLEALWEAFEAMRLEPPPSAAVWLRDFFDTQMASLSSPDGVFWRCSPGQHQIPDAWEHLEPPDPGMFEQRQSVPAHAGTSSEPTRQGAPS